MKLKKLLVPVDFSRYSAKALEYALLLADQFGGEIDLLHVDIVYALASAQSDISSFRFGETETSRRERLHQQLADFASPLNERGIPLKYTVLHSASAQSSKAILEYIDEHPFDMLVMGTHGHTGLKHALLGSVTEQIVRNAPLPVATVHKGINQFKFRRILVPIDFSEHSRYAADRAAEMARALNSELILLHVIEQFPAPVYYPETLQTAPLEDPDIYQRAMNFMDSFSKRFCDMSLSKVIAVGRTYQKIVEYAQRNSADMIIMTTHGLHGLERLISGSTTEKVVRYSEIPVISYRGIQNLDTRAGRQPRDTTMTDSPRH